MTFWGQPNRQDIAAECAIREVIVGYCRCVDVFDDAALVQLFTEDGEWDRPGQMLLKGRGSIGVFLKGRDRSVTIRHVISNVLIDVQTADVARALSYWSVFKTALGKEDASALQPFAMGEYHDQFRFEEGRWRIAHRETRFVFRNT